MNPAEPIVSEAIAHALRRAGTDPDFHYHMALTETLERLCAAHAALTGEDARRLFDEISQGVHMRGIARETVLKQQVHEVESLLDEHYLADTVSIADVRAALERGRQGES